jgi:hypothetical protein
MQAFSLPFLPPAAKHWKSKNEHSLTHAGSGEFCTGAADELGERQVPKLAMIMSVRNTT